ncbi:hypothetical protein [Salirhabdus salicampi]|uniref:hypothetical protein n=1 Tax=Salirhabdus salicampi TaxID=476102 RepID=UPI0020C4708C|nr:hypothetical protein [Salirhabdus salicampi]MCP8616307.1 hypothetical protein [Salirhabdus salicampi]
MEKRKWLAGMFILFMSLGMFGNTSFAGNGQSELAKVRKATAKYHTVENAIADGYEPVGPAIEVPGFGTMGYHYINFAYLANPQIELEKPEVLLYTATKDQKDSVRLVGVEYVVASVDWEDKNGITHPGWDGAEPPSLFGEVFEGPMAGHGPGEPWHYDKHVWIWQANPNGVNEPIWPESPGLFSQFNPNVKCEGCFPADME